MVDAETCTSCGEIIPEGWQVCPICEAKRGESDIQISANGDGTYRLMANSIMIRDHISIDMAAKLADTILAGDGMN